jgi:hypothetical protein
MTFNQGQRVRIKDKRLVGIVEKKLTSLDNVYVVTIDDASRNDERLVRGEDLEIFADVA